MSTRVARVFWTAVVAMVVLFVAETIFRTSSFFQTPAVSQTISVYASLAKLAGQFAGFVFAFMCAKRFGEGNPVRVPWMLVGVWCLANFFGQLVLSFHVQFLGRIAPVPSLADLFFSLGYASIITGLVWFVLAYRASGFPLGRFRDHALVGLAACAVFAVMAYFVLVPIALAPSPFLERFVNVGYPLLDLVTLVPTLVLLRISMQFAGGRLSGVWRALLLGVLFGAGGDFVFADMDPEHLKAVSSIANLLFILGYWFSAYGAYKQYELVSE